MSRALAKLARLKREQRLTRMSAEERDALERIEVEAAEAGAEFRYPAAARLRPSTVLGVLRRDGFRCKACGGQATLTVDGAARNFNGLDTVCAACLDPKEGDE